MAEKTSTQQLDEFFEDWIVRMERLRSEQNAEDACYERGSERVRRVLG
jgi:hypothetical protein